MNKERTVLITGATGTIGRAIAKLMAEWGFHILFTARSEEKAKLLVSELTEIKLSGLIKYFICDLGSKQQVSELSKEIDQPLDVLINNAAISPQDKRFTTDQIEMQWAVNVLGYHWVMKFFIPHLLKTDRPRIVNVASYWAGHLDLTDPEFNKRTYDNNTAYMQSKQADRMLSKYYADALKDKGIMVNSCHPGDANSRLSNDLGFGGHETPEMAAETPAFLATSVEAGNKTGKYFQYKKESPCLFSQNTSGVKKLYELCNQY